MLVFSNGVSDYWRFIIFIKLVCHGAKRYCYKIEKNCKTVFAIPEFDISDDLYNVTLDNWDSLKQIAIAEAVEREFNISLSVTEILEMDNVESIINVIERKQCEYTVA